MTTAVGSRAVAEPLGFIADLSWQDVPPAVQRRVAWLLLDFVAVSVAGRAAPAATIAADYASAVHAGDRATALVDGRRLSVPGAAWSNGVLANVLDWDDGHRLTKGHPGAIVVPAALAAAEAADASLEELLVAIVVGYEIAIRAGIRQHARSPEYHASGSWGSLGAAAAAARLFALGPARTRHALGLAEYHAPIALIMRSVDDPAMTKDATGWGAFLGTSSALLAQAGFTALESTFLVDWDPLELGARWELTNLYVKPYPCCRWTQPAIAAACRLREARHFAAADVERVTIRTFAAAGGLARRLPATTEDAQYNLVWPTAYALVHGDFGVDGVLRDFRDPEVAAIDAKTAVVVDAAMTDAFPARRLANVEVVLAGDRVLRSGPTEAGGEPEDPSWEAVVERKARRFVDPSITASVVQAAVPAPNERLGGRTLADLLGLLAFGSSGGHA